MTLVLLIHFSHVLCIFVLFLCLPCSRPCPSNPHLLPLLQHLLPLLHFRWKLTWLIGLVHLLDHLRCHLSLHVLAVFTAPSHRMAGNFRCPAPKAQQMLSQKLRDVTRWINMAQPIRLIRYLHVFQMKIVDLLGVVHAICYLFLPGKVYSETRHLHSKHWGKSSFKHQLVFSLRGKSLRGGLNSSVLERYMPCPSLKGKQKDATCCWNATDVAQMNRPNTSQPGNDGK